MAIPAGYKTPEEIAVELKVPVSRIQRTIIDLNIIPSIFPDDRRRRYYGPDEIKKITDSLEKR